MLETIKVDLLIPVYKNYDQIVSLIEEAKKQENVEIEKIVIPLTLSNTDIDEKLKKYFVENNIISFDLNKDYFSHSLTRQHAIKKYCSSDIVILMSQDVKLASSNSFYNLVKDIHDHKCVYSYGRQLCPKKSLEKYIRNKNYPAVSYFVTKADIEKMQIMAFFASDAFSALDRNVFIKLDGYHDYDIMMNEDMLYSYFVLEAGYTKKYCADAEVIHYHTYTLKQLYRRYYDTGKFYTKVKLFNDYKSTDSGFKLAFYVLGQCFKHFYIRGLFRWPFDMAARYIGMKKGKKAKQNKEGK